MLRLKHFLFLLIAAISFNAQADSFNVQAEPLRIYAASSMTNVVNEMVKQFEKTQAISVSTIYAGSASLARQIAQGAPADLYISANLKWMDYLVSQGVIDSDAVTNVATNELVVIAPKDQAVKLDITQSNSWLAALSGSRLAIGQPDVVPAGIYAKQALIKLGVWQAVQPHLAPSNNVRLALALVERKEVPLGIVYKSDMYRGGVTNGANDSNTNSEKTVVVASLPSDLHAKIIYPMAGLNDRPATAQFAQFMLSAKGQAIFERFGFAPVTNER